MTKVKSSILLLVCGLPTLLFAGCSDDDAPTEPAIVLPGAIEIQSPDSDEISDSSVQLSWPQSTASDFSAYMIVGSAIVPKDETLITIEDPAVTSYVVQGLSAETDYRFRVDLALTGGDVVEGKPIDVRTEYIDVANPRSKSVINDGGIGGGRSRMSPPYELARTPDILVDNFVRAYQEKNFVEFSKLLHNEFQFFFWEEDIVRLGLEAPGWDRVSELGATQNMFSGAPGIDYNGVPVPGIVKIAMTKSDDTIAAWLPSNQADPLFDSTLVRRYRFFIDVTHDGISIPVQVRGIEEFYVTQVQIEGQLVFQLKFWMDLGTDLGGSKISNEDSSWGHVKALYGG